MKATGVVRRIDDLGRIVVPKEIRNRLGIEEGQPFELFIDGKGVCFRPYDPADANIERQLDEQGEYEYILECIESSEDLDEVTVMQQLRCLWTAYCLHGNLDVDTAEYDNRMMEMWNVMQENESAPYSSDEFGRFYNAMSKHLV